MFGTLFPMRKSRDVVGMTGYSDSDWYGDKDDKKNTTGYIFFYERAPISWSSTKKPVLAFSSCEAEYVGTSKVACQAAWLGSLMKELNFDLSVG